jgi:hypothetical protein
MKEIFTITFLGQQTGNKLNGKTYGIHSIPKLSSVCFPIRVVTTLITTDALKSVYFAYSHSIISYRSTF